MHGSANAFLCLPRHVAQVGKMTARTLILGQTLTFANDPFKVPIAEAAMHVRHGGVLVEDGLIAALGSADDLLRAHPDATVTDMGSLLLTAGFVDCHAHYPQTAIIASWGKRLVDWLNTYTFPEEARFCDASYAREVAGRYLDLTLKNGTTTVCSYCTVHPRALTRSSSKPGSAGFVSSLERHAWIGTHPTICEIRPSQATTTASGCLSAGTAWTALGMR